MINITSLKFDSAVEELVLEVLRSGVIAQGPKVAELETRFADMYGMKNVVAVNNGTTALIAALMAHGIGSGDEVITSPFTFAATLNAILVVGAKPVFADIRLDDFNINPSLVEPLITSRTKAILPVHLYGQAANMSQINELAKRKNLIVIQDAAQAQGAQHKGEFVGSSHTATFSLYATKNMTTAEGGLISTEDNEVAERIRVLRNQGMRARYDYVMMGNNWRLTDLQAAVGLPQLDRYEENVSIRARNAEFYSKAINQLPGINLPEMLPNNKHVWHQYTLRITEDSTVSRDEFIEKLSEHGVGSGAYYPRAVYDYEAFRGHPLVGKPNCPAAEMAAKQVVSIPVHPHLSTEDLNHVAKAIHRVAGLNS